MFINEDLCAASMEIKRNQLPLLKQARQEGKIAFFRHTKLIIRERTSLRSPSARVSETTSRRVASGDSEVTVAARNVGSERGLWWLLLPELLMVLGPGSRCCRC